MVQYKSLISTQHPSHWKVVRNKAFLSITGEIVGKRANEFVLLSLTTNGVIVRDVESGKGKFPKDFDTYQVVKPNDLVFCLFDIDETPRTVGLVEKEGMLTGAYTALKVNQKRAFPQFVYYYYLAVDNIKGLKPYYSGLRKTIRTDKFLQIYIPLPPLDEQEKIVSYLEDKTSKIDAYVADKEKEIELLQELKQKTIADAVTKGLNPDAKMKDSGISWIGEIPEHWEVRHLSQVSYEHYISNKEVHHQNLLSLSYGRIIRKDINTTEGLLPASFDTYQIVEEGNIVMRLTDLQNDHKSLRVGLVKEEGIVTSAYVCLGVYDSVYPSYLYNVLHSYDIKKLFYSMGGGLRQNLNWQGLKKLDIPLPPKDEQQAIVAYIEEKCEKIDKLASELQSEIDYLKEYKQRLIADCVTGQINVQNEMI